MSWPRSPFSGKAHLLFLQAHATQPWAVPKPQFLESGRPTANVCPALLSRASMWVVPPALRWPNRVDARQAPRWKGREQLGPDPENCHTCWGGSVTVVTGSNGMDREGKGVTRGRWCPCTCLWPPQETNPGPACPAALPSHSTCHPQTASTSPGKGVGGGPYRAPHSHHVATGVHCHHFGLVAGVVDGAALLLTLQQDDLGTHTQAALDGRPGHVT